MEEPQPGQVVHADLNDGVVLEEDGLEEERKKGKGGDEERSDNTLNERLYSVSR